MYFERVYTVRQAARDYDQLKLGATEVLRFEARGKKVIFSWNG